MIARASTWKKTKNRRMWVRIRRDFQDQEAEILACARARARTSAA